jgi:nitroreductase
MDIYEAIRTRKSVRSYTDRPVDKETLVRLLDAARLAPSASNRQEWRFVVVRDSATRQRLSEAASNQRFVAEAPVVLACCAETEGHVMPCGLECFPIDVALAVDHLTLAAAAEGLGTCWIGAFNEAAVREILDIPKAVRIVALLPVGYPKDPKPVEKSRKSLDDIVHYDLW